MNSRPVCDKPLAGRVTHGFNPRTLKAEVARSLLVQDHPGLHSEFQAMQSSLVRFCLRGVNGVGGEEGEPNRVSIALCFQQQMESDQLPTPCRCDFSIIKEAKQSLASFNGFCQVFLSQEPDK